MREMEDLLAKEEKRGPATQRLTESLEDALLLLCAAPLATVKVRAAELSRFGRLPQSTLRDQLNRLVAMGLADSVSHRLPDLGPRPQLRFFPTEAGIIAAGKKPNTARNASSPSTRCPGSGSASWPSVSTPWPWSITSPL